MSLIHVTGNTWYIDGKQCIPLYKTSSSTCVLLDTGELSDRTLIEETLSEHHLQLQGILITHAHTDHAGNTKYLKEKYHVPIAMSLGESGISSSPQTLRAYFHMFSPRQLLSYEAFREMIVIPDRIIMPGETVIHFCGTEFKILPTPGHSPAHISIVTKDHVLYLGDALLTSDALKASKLPYFFSIQDTLDTMSQLRQYTQCQYLTAHKGLCTDPITTIDKNIEMLQTVSKQILDCVENSMTFDEIYKSVCEKFYLLSENEFKCKRYERIIQTYVNYLTDTDQIESFYHRGVTYYKKF